MSVLAVGVHRVPHRSRAFCDVSACRWRSMGPAARSRVARSVVPLALTGSRSALARCNFCARCRRRMALKGSVWRSGARWPHDACRGSAVCWPHRTTGVSAVPTRSWRMCGASPRATAPAAAARGDTILTASHKPPSHSRCAQTCGLVKLSATHRPLPRSRPAYVPPRWCAVAPVGVGVQSISLRLSASAHRASRASGPQSVQAPWLRLSASRWLSESFA